MNILINKITNIVEGINSLPNPLQYVIDVVEGFSLSKNITVQEGVKQKVNDFSQLLFNKEVYRVDLVDEIIGQDETLDDTGVPKMVKVQKKNVDGDLLYIEPILNEHGTIIDYVEVTNPTDEEGNDLEPSTELIQETSTNGALVFLKDSIETKEVQVLDHIEEVIEDTGEPIMIPNMVAKYVNIKDNPEFFTAQEIVLAKFQSILDSSQKDYILADSFLSEEDIDLTDANHTANTGIGLLQLLPNGQAKTLTISLETPTANFELLELIADSGVDVYLSGKKFVDNKLTLTSPISNCTIKFVNTTNKPKLVKSYAIGY